MKQIYFPVYDLINHYEIIRKQKGQYSDVLIDVEKMKMVSTNGKSLLLSNLSANEKGKNLIISKFSINNKFNEKDFIDLPNYFYIKQVFVEEIKKIAGNKKVGGVCIQSKSTDVISLYYQSITMDFIVTNTSYLPWESLFDSNGMQTPDFEISMDMELLEIVFKSIKETSTSVVKLGFYKEKMYIINDKFFSVIMPCMDIQKFSKYIQQFFILADLEQKQEIV